MALIRMAGLDGSLRLRKGSDRRVGVNPVGAGDDELVEEWSPLLHAGAGSRGGTRRARRSTTTFRRCR
eukprot:767990-Hanusia_phi.AAC.8